MIYLTVLESVEWGFLVLTVGDGLFVIWSSKVSAIQGFLIYQSLWRNDRDFQYCLLYRG